MPSLSLSDNFELGDVLGIGTVGTIYAAVDRRNDQHVAIKKLHPSVSASPLIRARFRREMLVLDRLQHPNIIRYLEGGDDDGQLYYVMELVQGGTVKELLEANGKLHWKLVVEVGRQICSALQFAHNHGVIHRDLKPSNLFLTKSGEVKLGDFGIARDLQGTEITSSGTMVGTHAYMAPEQIKGESAITGKADLYSLGCCLFEMLVGRTPFVGDNVMQLFDQHLKKQAPRVREFLPDCPTELDAVVDRLLAKSPDDRPFNARSVQAVMLRLGNPSGGSCEQSSETAKTGDVASADVTGRDILQARIQQRLSSHHERDVSWTKLGLIVAAVAVLVLLVTIFGK